MMKRMIRVLAFLLVFVTLYMVVDDILGTKADDAIEPMEKLYLLPKDTVDVMCIGASHIGMNLDNKQVWDEYGIASYNLWGGMQPTWNSYYFLKEGLKEQSPKVAIVEVFLAGTTVEYSTEAVAMKNIHGMRLSLDKVQAALASMPTWQKAVSVLWGMPYYHTRFRELNEQDMQLFSSRYDTRINEVRLPQEKTTQVNMLDYNAITETLPLSEKNEKYIRKMIDLCKAKDTELIFLIAPYEATAEECMRLNTVEQIAREAGVECLNYLKIYEEADIDPATDFYDIGHLGYSGIEKFSHHLGGYLDANYDLPDRRLDEGHIWHSAPEADVSTRAYALEETFIGDGAASCVDTGVKLYGNRYDSWTLLTRLDMRIMEENMVYLSCFSEEVEKGYYGLLIRKSRENQLAVILGNNIDVIVPETEKDVVDLAIVKESQTYSVYLDGKKVVNQSSLPCEAYEGNLLIGCQELKPNGEKFRFSRTKVLNLEVYSSVLDEYTITHWSPKALPEPELPLGVGLDAVECIYTLPEKFDGLAEGKADYLDTGLQLMKDSSSRFTLLATIVPRRTSGDNVFFSSFSEVPGQYRGILVRQNREDSLNIVVGNNHGFDVPVTVDQPLHLALIKDGNFYTVYLDGEKLCDRLESSAPGYEGTFLVAAQQDAEGNIFRISDPRMDSLTIFAGVMPEEDVLTWSYADAPDVAEKKPVTSIYTMRHAFAGDGADNYVHTGVSLFDNPGKDWTIHTVIRPRRGEPAGVFLSAFSEEPDQYRGLLLRQDQEEAITLYVGQLQTMDIEVPEGNDRLNLVIVKDGFHYSVYLNGALIRTLESSCTAYPGTLLVGCQEDVDGTPFRFSTARVDALQVWDGALPEAEAIRLSAQETSSGRFD